ncbi:transcription-repair coupling factor, partial [Bacillus sp. GMa5/2]
MNGVEDGLKEQLISGMATSSRSLLMAALYKKTKKSQLIVTHNLYQAQKVHEDLVALLGEKDVWLYPVNELIASEIGVASPELKAQRIEVLNRLAAGENGIIVAPVAGLRRFLPIKELWKQKQIEINLGQEIDLDALLYTLHHIGYERKSMVEAPGEFSLRGGILDIYPLTEELPFRIEFFDTEVDSIRLFDVDEQRSQGKKESVRFGPATEFLFSQEELKSGIQHLEEGLTKTMQKLSDDKLKTTVLETVSHEIEMLKNGQSIEQMFKYLSIFYKEPASLIDYLPEDGVVILDEISRIQETASHLETEEAEWYISLLGEGTIIQDLSFSHAFEGFL